MPKTSHTPKTLRAIARGPFVLPPPVEGDAYLVDDLAVALNVSRRTVDRWCHDGRLKTILRGGYRVITHAEAARFIAAGAVNGQRPMGNPRLIDEGRGATP